MAKKEVKKEKTKSKSKVKEVDEKEQPQVLNSVENLSEMIINIVTNIKEENYKMLTTDKTLTSSQKMKLRNNMYAALSILKALNNLYTEEEKAILDISTYRTAMCTFKETNHKKLSSLLKDGRESTIESYKSLCDDIVKELDKLDDSYTSVIVELTANDDDTTQYVLKKIPTTKLDDILLNTIKKLIKVREHIKREQNKSTHGKISTEYFRGDNIIARMSESLDYFKEDDITEPFTQNMVRYILETLSIRFNIMKNPDTTKPEKLEQLKEFNRIISKMDATNFVNSASILFDTHFDYTQLLHVYHELEDALSTHIHTKKLSLLKELDTLLSKLQKDILKYTKAYKKCLSKSAYNKLAEKLKTYSFIDNNSKIDNDYEDEEDDKEIIEDEIIDEDIDSEEDIDTDDEDSIYEDEDEESLYTDLDYDDLDDLDDEVEATKLVSSRKVKTEAFDISDDSIPNLYDNDDYSDDSIEKDNSVSKALSTVGSKKQKEASIKPTTDSINEMVKSNTKPSPKTTTRPKATTPKTTTQKPKPKDYNNIGARLSGLTSLLNKKK